MAGKVIISCAITDGPFWPPVAARCRLRRGQRQSEGMFASVSRTISGSTKGTGTEQCRPGHAGSGTSSKDLAWKLRHLPKPGPCLASRVVMQ